MFPLPICFQPWSGSSCLELQCCNWALPASKLSSLVTKKPDKGMVPSDIWSLNDLKWIKWIGASWEEERRGERRRRRAEGSFSGLFFLPQFSTGEGRQQLTIWLNSGIHSREWISQATVIWTVKKDMLPCISPEFWWAQVALQHPTQLDPGDEIGRHYAQTW